MGGGQASAPRGPAASEAVDGEEVARFAALADQWWDAEGSFAPLHGITPVRVRYVRDALAAAAGRDAGADRPLAGLEILDVGCGGGLLAEPLTRLGAAVTGLDPGREAVAAAAAHARGSGLEIDYRCGLVEDLAGEGRRFDAVVALEVVEHVPDLPAFVSACAALARAGAPLVFATINRTPRAFAFAIVGAEYVLGWLPRGTHDWRRFSRPSELGRALRRNGMAVADVSGMSFDLLRNEWRLTGDVSVNYILFARRSGPSPPS